MSAEPPSKAVADEPPRWRRPDLLEVLAVLAGIALLPAGVALAGLCAFVALMGGLDVGTFLAPESGVEQAKMLVVGIGGAALGGCGFSSGLALLTWAIRRSLPAWRVLLVAPGVAALVAFAAAVFASSQG